MHKQENEIESDNFLRDMLKSGISFPWSHNVSISRNFEIYLLIKFIAKTSIIKEDRGEMSVIKSCSFNFKGNRAHLLKKTSLPQAKIYLAYEKKRIKIPASLYAIKTCYNIQSF